MLVRVFIMLRSNDALLSSLPIWRPLGSIFYSNHVWNYVPLYISRGWWHNLLPQSYYHILAATSRYVAKRGATWLRRSCNVRQRDPSVIKRGKALTGFQRTRILNLFKIQVRFPQAYNDVATRYRQRNYSVTWHSTAWLERSRNVQPNNVCSIHTPLYISFLTRCDTICFVMLHCGLVAQHYSVAVARYSVAQHN